MTFKSTGFSSILDHLPEDFYIIVDAAYPPSDRLPTPYLGTKLSDGQENTIFYRSQCRIAIEQTFGVHGEDPHTSEGGFSAAPVFYK